MKKFACFLVFASLVIVAHAQEEKVFITGFEYTEEVTAEWSFTGGAFIESFVDFPTDPAPVEGEAALVVIYDNAGSEWQHGRLDFTIPPVDIRGMREFRMSVYFTPDSTGDLRLRLDLPNGNILGFADVPSAGEWHELVWKIDRKMSEADFLSSLSYIQGFIVPTPGDAAGEVWIDNMYAFRPADIPAEVDEILVYGFNEADPDTGAPIGWTKGSEEGYMPELSEGLAEPTEGSDAMAMFAWSGYLENVQTTNALEAFDRWAEALEIQFDVRTPEPISGGWMQSRIVLRSGITDDPDSEVESSLKEIGYYDAVDDWKTLLWEVDMTDHIPNIEHPDGWLEITISTNQNADADGSFILIDNFRVTVPSEPVDVGNWSVY